MKEEIIEMKLEEFVQRFLENEASREFSFVGFDGDKEVGLILRNIKIFNGIKTMRCGALAVIPEYRNYGAIQFIWVEKSSNLYPLL